VARAATGQYFPALKLVLLGELWSVDFLMPLLIGAFFPSLRRPRHGEHLFLGPDELLRVAMTLEAPFHIQRRDLISQRHQIDSSVTSRTPDAFVHVNAVIEIDEIGKVVNSRPLDRLARAPALSDRFQIRAVRPDLRMAVHAGPGRRNPGKRELLHRRVTIAAIYSVIANVVLMTELNGLLARNVRLSVIRGAVEFQQQPDDYGDEEDRAEDADFGDEIGASMKDLAHRRLGSGGGV
jgi:hypothetical protein